MKTCPECGSAHEDLDEVYCGNDCEITALRRKVDQSQEVIRFAKLVCKEGGGWLHPLRLSLDEYEKQAQKEVSGE